MVKHYIFCQIVVFGHFSPPPRDKSQTQTTSSASRKPYHKINNKSLIHVYFNCSINFNRSGHHYHVALFAPIASTPHSLCVTSIALLLRNHLKNIKCFILHTKKHGNIHTCKTITPIGGGRGGRGQRPALGFEKKTLTSYNFYKK